MRKNIQKVSGLCIALNVIARWKGSCIWEQILSLLLQIVCSQISLTVEVFSSPLWLWKWFRFQLPWRKVNIRFGKKDDAVSVWATLCFLTEEHLFIFLFSYLTYELVLLSAEVESCKTHFIKQDEQEHDKFYSRPTVMHIVLLTNTEEKVFCGLLFKFMLLYCFRHKINCAANKMDERYLSFTMSATKYFFSSLF